VSDRPFTILVIDDDEIDRERVRRLLAQAAIVATVLEEEDPVVALATLQRERPDVVVLDYSFPRHDGLMVLRDLRELDASVPVLVLTGFDETALAVELMKAGAVDYLAKNGLTAQRLGQSVRHAVRLRDSEFAARAAEEALRASEEFNRRILDASPDCIKVLDLDGRLLSMSAGGQRAFGVDDFSRVRGRSWLEFWNDEHRRLAEAALREAQSGGTGHFVGHCPTLDGRPLWWDVLVTPMLGADGKPERLLTVSRDVTEQHRRSEFEQQLIGIVSHDLRNPIHAMMMAGTLLSEELSDDSHHGKLARRVVRSGRRAAKLIRDLLDFTQIRLGGGLPVQKQDANVHAICQQVVDELLIQHPDRNLVHHAEGDGRGQCDPDRVAQIIGNLAHNALAYSPAGTPVTLHSHGAGERLRIEVHNLGTPIPDEVRTTLFQPFKRGVRRNEPDRSIGLGLFIVHQIASAHGGTVDVESSERGGTTFRVELPRA
jgi:sigma-B regulation protein RsbU (phosphoserine phosphatase)